MPDFTGPDGSRCAHCPLYPCYADPTCPARTATPFNPMSYLARHGPPDYQPWRSIGLDAAQIPAGATRVRDPRSRRHHRSGRLAVTGPRLRSVVGLTEFLRRHGPVLVSWPQAFLFPCVHDIVEVAGGLAQAPRAVIEAPRIHGRVSAVTTDQIQGGDFAALRPFGRLYEVPTRLAGHLEIDWALCNSPPTPPPGTPTNAPPPPLPSPDMETYRCHIGPDNPDMSP